MTCCVYDMMYHCNLIEIFNQLYRYTTDTEILDICSFLDPRVKSLPYISPEERQIIHDCVIDICVGAADRPTRPHDETGGNKFPGPKDVVCAAANNSLAGLLSGMFDDDQSEYVEDTVKDKVSKEISRYLKEIKCEMQQNPLVWQKSHALTYPYLSLAARTYLAIQGTSVAAERVFSTAGLVLNAQRSRLDPDLVDKILFLNKNMSQLE